MSSNDITPQSNPESFMLRLKRFRWAPDDPSILALQFTSDVRGYQNSQLMSIMLSRKCTPGEYHEYGDIKIPAGTFQSVVAGQFAIRYKFMSMEQKQMLYDWLTTAVNKDGECDLLLKIYDRFMILPSSLTYADWLPPRKIYEELVIMQSMINPATRLQEVLFNEYGFQGLHPVYENYNKNSLIDLIRTGLPQNLRPCDTVIIYVACAKTTAPSAPTTGSDGNEIDKEDEFIFQDKDDEIAKAICTRPYNGANVTIIFDAISTDLADAPYNCTLNSNGSKVTEVKLRPNPKILPYQWPKEVKVIYGVSKTLAQTQIAPYNRYSTLYQQSWLAECLTQLLKKNLRTASTPSYSTYRQLLQEIQTFYTSQIKLKDKLCPEDVSSVECLKTLIPMLGGLDVSSLNDQFLKPSPFNPKPQNAPLKKAVLVAVDCWTNGKARYVNDGYCYAPYICSPRNDVILMYKLLTERFGFLPQNIAILRNQPNKASVLKAIDWLMSDNQDGNTLLFHFSGHGSQTADNDGDEVDNNDEFIILQDEVLLQKMTDDEVYEYMIKRVPPKCKLWCVFDSCHSGTMGDTTNRYTGEFEDESGKTVCLREYANDSKRDSNNVSKNIYVIGATSDLTSTYEFTPKRMLGYIPPPPVNYTWDYPDNPPLCSLIYFMYVIMEERKWAPIGLKQLLIELKKKYNTLFFQSKCIPTLGCFKALPEDDSISFLC